ncbi:MAG: hypothetical protein AAFX56_19030 [Pseudomonadota bacterium]
MNTRAFTDVAAAVAIAAALAAPAAVLADSDVEDLEVTMEVVDSARQLDEIIAELRPPRAERDSAAGELEAARAATAAAEAPRTAQDDSKPAFRSEPQRDNFDNDYLVEETEDDFEAEDDFEEGEIVDEDIFDELPVDDMGTGP